MLQNFFKLDENNTTAITEIIAGISTFFTLAFIIAVNPAILSDAGIDFAAGFVATIMASALGCFIIGIWAGWPVAIAPGMGLNAYFAYVVVLEVSRVCSIISFIQDAFTVMVVST